MFWTGNIHPGSCSLILETITLVHTCRESWLDIYVCVYKIFFSSANLAVCILLKVIPKSLKLKYSSTKCRKSALKKHKQTTSTSKSCTDSSQTNKTWFLPTLLSNLSPILLLLYCLQFVTKMKACELEIGFIESARLVMSGKWKGLKRSNTHSGQFIIFAERR